MANPYHDALGRTLPDRKKPRRAKPSPSHIRSKQQEREIAERLVPRSGAGMIKGDVRIKGVLRVECKTTKHQSFSVTRDMLRKIEDAAAASGELPAIVVEFNDGEGNKVSEVAVVPIYVLNELIRD